MSTPSKGKQQAAKTSGKKEGFTAEEKAAMRARARELKAGAEGESAVQAAIAAMSPQDRAIAARVHELVKATAPGLTPKTWYGMPAYGKDGKALCFFKASAKFGARYATIGFNDVAALDDGRLWPTDYAILEFTPAVEKAVRALIAKAVG